MVVYSGNLQGGKLHFNFDRQRRSNLILINRQKDFSIPYTSSRCDKIAKQIIPVIKQITPDYNINFAWKTIKLKNTITPSLKPKTNQLDKSGIVYGYNCLCDAKYVGESKRKFLSRIQEHNQKSRATAVYNHIQTCGIFFKIIILINSES